LKSVERTENLVVVEDHFTHCWLAHNIKSYLSDSWVAPGIRMRSLWPSKEYQLSGECDELYKNVWMDSDSIVKEIGDMLV
jgi:transketolase C-terminal domain/subunit